MLIKAGETVSNYLVSRDPFSTLPLRYSRHLVIGYAASRAQPVYGTIHIGYSMRYILMKNMILLLLLVLLFCNSWLILIKSLNLERCWILGQD